MGRLCGQIGPKDANGLGVWHNVSVALVGTWVTTQSLYHCVDIDSAYIPVDSTYVPP